MDTVPEITASKPVQARKKDKVEKNKKQPSKSGGRMTPLLPKEPGGARMAEKVMVARS